MAADIYEQAVADAKKLREKTTQVVEQQILEKFRPKIDAYIEQALLEADDDEKADDAGDEDILLGVDIDDRGMEAGAGDYEMGDDGEVARDVEASIEGEEEGEQAALQVNTDGSVTLDLDKVIVPEEPSVEPVEQPGSANDSAVSEPETLIASDVKEALGKLDALKQIAESVDDKVAAFTKLSKAFDRVAFAIVPSDLATVDRSQLAGLTELAERINGAYIYVRESDSVQKKDRNGLCARFEGTYARVNSVLSEAVCSRIARKVARIERVLSKFNNLNEAARKQRGGSLYQEIDGLCRILEAVVDRTGSAKAERLKNRIATLVKEIKKMTKRSALNEEEVVLRLELPDEEAKDKVLDVLGAPGGEEEAGDDVGGDDLSGLLGGDEEEEEVVEDEGLEMEMAGMGYKEHEEREDEGTYESASVARDLARLFEDDDAGDDDDDVAAAGASDISLEDLGGDIEGEGDDEGDAAASSLEAVADVLRDVEGNVEIEVVEDEGMDVGGDDVLDLDLGGEEGEVEVEEGDDYSEMTHYEADDNDGEEVIDEDDDAGDDPMDEGDEEVVEVDMKEVARALRSQQRGTLAEMDSSYHKQEMPGPDVGIDDFGGATESSEAFVDADDDEVIAEARRRRAQRRRRASNLSEGRPSNPSAREVATLRRELAESKRKQQEGNLLSTKLLYTNKLLQRSDLTVSQKKRIVAAMDEAGNLREARLLYKNLTRAIERRKGRLSEGRHRPVGSASQVTTSGGFNRSAAVASDNPLLNESIDIDVWKKHAGLD